MQRKFMMIVERDEDGWLVGSIHGLRGAHTQGATMEELTANMREVIALCLEDDPDFPLQEFVGVQRVAVGV